MNSSPSSSCRSNWRRVPILIAFFFFETSNCLIHRIHPPQESSDDLILLLEVPKLTFDDLKLPTSESFGVVKGAKISVDVTFHQDAEANNTFLVMLTTGQLERYRMTHDRYSPSLNATDGEVTMANFLAAFRSPVSRSLRMEYVVPSKDRYTILLVNGDKEHLKFSSTASLINPAPQPTTTSSTPSEAASSHSRGTLVLKEHLSIEQVAIVPVLLYLVWLYVATTGILLGMLLTFWRDRRLPIHWLMLATFATKGTSLFLYWWNFTQLSEQGELSFMQNVIPRFFSKIQDIVALMLYLLTSLGWKVLRSQLSMTEVRFASGVCVISFYLGIFQVSCSGSKCGGYDLARYILHAMAFLCIIVAINFNIAMLNGALLEAAVTLGTAELYKKYDAFKAYRWIFVTYIMKPTVLVFFKMSLLDGDDYDDWVFVLMQNLSEYAIYLALMWSFRPFQPLRVLKDFISQEPQDSDESDGDTAE